MLDIYGTLGPACDSVEILEGMFRSGMTGVRLNLSHVTLEQAQGQIQRLHQAAQHCGLTAKLLIDMQGPELRVGALERPIELVKGEEVCLGRGGIPMPVITLPCLHRGQAVLMDDGKLLLRIVKEAPGSAVAVVERGGVLRPRKSIALPGANLRPPTMTESDRANIRLARQYGVTGVMQPFVRDRRDLETVRQVLMENGGEEIRLFAKIENMDGVNQLPKLLSACDEIVIARGDLGNAMPLWELPAVQKKIAAVCSRDGKPFMVVTQMLSSMENRSIPTRAEVSDIFNAILDGAASVMVTGETAVGNYPVETIRYLANTAREALRFRGRANAL